MKKVLSIVLLALVLTQAWGYSIVYFNFLAHRNYIASTLCVNKSKPSMHCNGKCHLMKELKKQEGSNEAIPTGLRSAFAEILLFKSDNQLFVSPELTITNIVFKSYKVFGSETSDQDIYHPPTV